MLQKDLENTKDIKTVPKNPSGRLVFVLLRR